MECDPEMMTPTVVALAVESVAAHFAGCKLEESVAILRAAL